MSNFGVQQLSAGARWTNVYQKHALAGWLFSGLNCESTLSMSKQKLDQKMGLMQEALIQTTFLRPMSRPVVL